MKLLNENNKLGITNGRITGWNCSYYNYYNDILNNVCNYCNETRPDWLLQTSIIVRLERKGITDGEPMSNDEKEWFIKLFSQTRTLIKDMDSVSLRETKAELIQIIREAKVKVSAIEEKENEDNRKLTAEQRKWKGSDKSVNPNISDAFGAVKERKARQSKLDKLAGNLANLGLELDDINELTANVERKRTGNSVISTNKFDFKKDKSLANIKTSALCLSERHHECVGSFNDGVSKVCDCNCHKLVVTEQAVEVPKKSFNFTKT